MYNFVAFPLFVKIVNSWSCSCWGKKKRKRRKLACAPSPYYDTALSLRYLIRVLRRHDLVMVNQKTWTRTSKLTIQWHLENILKPSCCGEKKERRKFACAHSFIFDQKDKEAPSRIRIRKHPQTLLLRWKEREKKLDCAHSFIFETFDQKEKETPSRIRIKKYPQTLLLGWKEREKKIGLRP